ncbi:MAG: hypothetical protein HYU66_27910, partial [Armatimonadetes bacterium]|nr:hypothetical protein [Armatimonadota bacterium]
ADLFPAAATDTAGRIVLAWMAFRGPNSRILMREQTAQGFGPPEVLADSPRDEWTPTVAPGPDGVVAVVWDSYQKGDYDVLARFRRGGRWGDPLPVAGAPTAEMNASAAFDPAGRLWVAYETSPAAWAKDWGALEKEGCSLYGGRNVAVRVVDGARVLEPKQALSEVMPQAARRRENVAPLALPRVGVDGAGRVWVSVRHRDPQRRVPVGSVWSTYAAAYAKDHWSPAMLLDQSDAILDSRPTFLPTTGGGLLAVSMTDHRQFEVPRSGRQANEDLSDAYLKLADAPAEPELTPVDGPIVAQPAAGTEAADIARMRGYRPDLDGQGLRLLRGEFHRHTEISPDGGGDGTLLDMWRYALDAADLDWIGNGDHDNGSGREQYWWETQKTTSIFQNPPYFMPMYTYERSANYPDGHRNVVFARRGVRTLARLRTGLGKAMDTEPMSAERPHSGDTQMLYAYLGALDGVCASHTSATDMGTDWRDHDPVREPIVEIYQGDRQNYERPDAPRANKEGDSLGGWRPYGFVSWALLKGYRLGFQSSSDHVSTHMSYCDVWVSDLSRQGILDAMKQRRVYGATDNILADYRCRAGGKDHLMGETFDADGPPLLRVRFEGSQPMAKVSIVRDNEVVYTTEPNQAKVELEWRDNQPPAGKTSYYYVRGEQADGELVWLSPMWIRFPG